MTERLQRLRQFRRTAFRFKRPVARAGFVPPGPGPVAIRIATWVLVGFFALKTVANVASQSAVERFVTTPATRFMVACLIALATSPAAAAQPDSM